MNDYIPLQVQNMVRTALQNWNKETHGLAEIIHKDFSGRSPVDQFVPLEVQKLLRTADHAWSQESHALTKVQNMVPIPNNFQARNEETQGRKEMVPVEPEFQGEVVLENLAEVLGKHSTSPEAIPPDSAREPQLSQGNRGESASSPPTPKQSTTADVPLPQAPAINTPSFLPARQLAEMLGLPKASVESFLRRCRKKLPDCYTTTEGRRRNEPQYLYRSEDVLPALQKHFRDSVRRTKATFAARMTDGKN